MIKSLCLKLDVSRYRSLTVCETMPRTTCTICRTPGLYRSPCQGKDIKTINIEIRYVVAQDVRMDDID